MVGPKKTPSQTAHNAWDDYNACNNRVNTRGSNRRGKSGGLAWKQGVMWENVDIFQKLNGECTRNIILNGAV